MLPTNRPCGLGVPLSVSASAILHLLTLFLGVGWKGHEIPMSRVLMIRCRDISGQNARVGPELMIIIKSYVI